MPIIEVEDSHWRHVETFAGKPVARYDREAGIRDAAGDPHRIGPEETYGQAAFDDMLALMRAFTRDPDAAAVEAIAIGCWGGEFRQTSAPLIELLVAEASTLPALRALYLGEITPDENEISWICQGDPAPLLGAFPRLEHLRVRAPGRGYAEGSPVGSLQSSALRSLCFQSGGLPRQAIEAVLSAQLPALEHLELWLGRDDYGAGATAELFVPLFSGKLFPNLRYLGLRNSEQVDAIAAALASAPILEQLAVLDLSLGTLTDVGAEALLGAPALCKLEGLHLHHNYLSEPVVERLAGLGIPDLNTTSMNPDQDEYEGQVYRFTAVGE